MQRFDIGNHHFPALARTALAEALVKTCPPNMCLVIYGASGGEATDIAIKTARHTRRRRRIDSTSSRGTTAAPASPWPRATAPSQPFRRSPGRVHDMSRSN